MVNRVTKELETASILKRVREMPVDPKSPLGEEIIKVRALLPSTFKSSLATLGDLMRTGDFREGYPNLQLELDRHREEVGNELRKVTGALKKTKETPLHPELTLRPKQVRFTGKLEDYFDEDKYPDQTPPRTGFVKYPTGLGKTIMIGLIVRALAHHHGDADILVLSPRGEINRQNESKIRKYQDPDVTVKDIDDIEAGEEVDATIATIQMAGLDLNKTPEQRRLKPHYHCIVLDECHRSFGEGMIELLRSRYPDAIIIGLSATPYVGSSKQASSLKTAFDYFEGEIDSITLMEACKDSDLTPIRANRIMLKKEDFSGCDTDEKMEARVNLPGRTKAAVKIAKEKIPAGEKGIIFCDGVEHSKATTKALNEAKINAVHLDGSSSDEEKRKAREGLENGSIQFVCNSDLLIEGFDDETLKHAIMLRPTFSLWMYEQMIGRICRLNEKDPNKIATVWDVIGQHSGQCTIHGLSRFYGNMKEEYMNGEIVFGPEKQMGERAPQDPSEKNGKGIQEEDTEVFIQDVIQVEEIAVVKIPRDAYYYSNPEWVRADLEAASVAQKQENPLSLRMDLSGYFNTHSGERLDLYEYIEDARRAHKKATGEDKNHNQILNELKTLAGFERGGEGDIQLAYFQDPEKLREALLTYAAHYHLNGPQELTVRTGHERIGKGPVVWGTHLDYETFVILSRDALEETDKKRALEEVKRRAGFVKEELPFGWDEVRLKEILVAFAAAYDEDDPSKLFLRARDKRMGIQIEIDGKQRTLSEVVGIVEQGWNLKGKQRTLEEVKKRTGFEYVQEKAEGDYFRDEAKVLADLRAFAAEAGIPLGQLLNASVQTRARVCSNEVLNLGQYVNRATPPGTHSTHFVDLRKLMTRLRISLESPHDPKNTPPPILAAAFEPPDVRQAVKDDLNRQTAEVEKSKTQEHLMDDDSVRKDLIGLAEALGVNPEDLKTYPQLPKVSFTWGEGEQKTSVAVFLQKVSSSRNLPTGGLPALHVLARLLFPEKTSDEIERLEMDKDYFEDHAETDLMNYATQIGIPHIRNININNPAHLNTRILCKSGETLSLQEYLLRFGEVEKKVKGNIRLAWPKLLELL